MTNSTPAERAFWGPFDNDRSLDEYCKHLELGVAELRGKRILDVGSGACARFAEEAALEGIGVVSVNPSWQRIAREPVKRLGAERRPQIVGDWVPATPVVAAVSSDLPFRPESFDVVTALYSVPMYLPQGLRAQRQTFGEIARVMRPGGILRAGPIAEIKTAKSFRMLAGLFASVVYIDDSDRPLPDKGPVLVSLLKAQKA